MKTSSKWILGILVSIPFLLLLKIFPLSALWFLLYLLSMGFIIKRKKTYFEKGAYIIYAGAAIAVIGKQMVTGQPNSGTAADSVEVIETLFQVMIMASSGLGGGLISHHIISNDQKK
ncbi:MAG: hypothetical protein ACI935_002135 [Moritella dasanensis]|jgi:hypothetical protein